MPLAQADFPLFGAMITMSMFFGWILWLWLLIWVYLDLFRRDDLSGWRKAGWVVLTLLLPFLGVFAYLIAGGRGMIDRHRAPGHQVQRKAFVD